MTLHAHPILDVTLALDPAGLEGKYVPQLIMAGRPPQRSNRAFAFPTCDWEKELLDPLATVAPECESLLDRAKYIGTQLFNFLIPDELRATYDRAFQQAHRDCHTFLLRLQVHESLANIPVELLYDTQHGIFLAANNFTTLVRGIPGSVLEMPIAEHPLHLLVVVANPRDAGALAVEEELRNLMQGLAKLNEVGLWKVDILRGANTLEQLRSHKWLTRCHVLHYIGHGFTDDANGRNGLILEDRTGQAHKADADALLSVLTGFRKLRLLVLNACHGGRQLHAKPFSSLAHQLLRPEIPAVVAMQRRIADVSAILFAPHLYSAVANCRSIGEAVNCARNALLLSERPEATLDWFNPQVYLRSPDGYLFATPSGVPPWESLAANELERGNVDKVFRIYACVADWDREAEWFTQSLTRLGQKALEQKNWSVLGLLSRHCEQNRIMSPAAGRWRRISDLRQTWHEDRLAELGRRLQSGDVFLANQAALECDKLIDLVSRQKQAQHDLYGGDLELWEKCWVDDLRELRVLRERYTGVVLSEAMIKVSGVLNRLASEKGMKVIMPERLATVCQTWSEGERDAAKAFFSHPVYSAGNLRAVREGLLENGSMLPSTLVDLMENLRTKLAEDWPLVWHALGDTSRARQHWEAGLRYVADHHQRLAIHHHLLLLALPDVNQTLVWSEAAVRSWASLFGSDARLEHSYWREMCACADEQTVVQMTKRMHEFVLTTLTQPASLGASPTQGLVHRDMIIDEICGLAPAKMKRSSSVLRFEADVAAAQHIERLSTRGLGTKYPLTGGLRSLCYLGLIPQLVQFYRELATTKETQEDLFKYRVLYSSLGRAWFLLHDEGTLEEILECLQGVACPSCSRLPILTGEGPLFTNGVYKELGLTLCRPECPRWAVDNPLHSQLDPTGSLFIADWQSLVRAAFLEMAAQELSRSDQATERACILLQAGSLPRGPYVDDEPSWQRVHAIVLERVRLAKNPIDEQRLQAYLPLLRLFNDWRIDENVQECLAMTLFVLADSCFRQEDFELSRVRAFLTEALFWKPDLQVARELLAAVAMGSAEALAELGQLALARAHLQELRRELDLAPTLTDELQRIRRKADLLETRLNAGEPTAEELLRRLLREAGLSPDNDTIS